MSGWRQQLDYAWRVAGSGLCFALVGLVCVLLSVAVFPLIRLISSGDAATRWRVRQCVYHVYRSLIRVARALGVISYELHGGERLLAPGQLVVANHPSLIDVLFIGSQMPQVDCIVKDALLRNPFLSAPVRWAGYIPNGEPERLIETCAATLHAGNSLLVFPEGTRSVPGQPLKLKRGAAHIALASGCDLLPVTVVCRPSSLTKTDVWYRVPQRRPHWSVTVGEPIRLAGLLVPGETRTQAARRVTEHLAEYFSARIAGVAPLPLTSQAAARAGARAPAVSAAAS